MSTQTIETELSIITCGECGIAFGVPPKWVETRREDKTTFYCPNGHPRVFRVSEKDQEIARLKKQAEDAEVRKRWAETDRDQARSERDRLKKKLTCTKGQLTRAKRRVGNGVCPCCGQGFPDLREHMQQHHPDYKEPEATSAK